MEDDYDEASGIDFTSPCTPVLPERNLLQRMTAGHHYRITHYGGQEIVIVLETENQGLTLVRNEKGIIEVIESDSLTIELLE